MPHKSTNSIGEIIAQQRHKLGLTQQEVAGLSGVSVRLLRELEAGRANPGLYQLEKIAAELNLTLTLTPKNKPILGRVAEVLFNGELAGLLRYSKNQYSFRYADSYLQSSQPAISLTLPKQPEAFISTVLFSFFYGLLAEGVAKQLQCRELKIDENDHFTRLLRTAHTETIGAVTVREILPSL